MYYRITPSIKNPILIPISLWETMMPYGIIGLMSQHSIQSLRTIKYRQRCKLSHRSIANRCTIIAFPKTRNGYWHLSTEDLSLIICSLARSCYISWCSFETCEAGPIYSGYPNSCTACTKATHRLQLLRYL